MSSYIASLDLHPRRDGYLTGPLAHGENPAEEILFFQSSSEQIGVPGSFTYNPCMQIQQTVHNPGIIIPSTSVRGDQTTVGEWTGDHTTQYYPGATTGFANFRSSSYNESTSNDYGANLFRPPAHESIKGEDGNDHVAGADMLQDNQYAPRRKRTNPGPLTCGWEGCTSTDVFSCDRALWRHIKTMHVSPDAFECPVKRCGRSFGRKDKCQDHIRSSHRKG
ncbi:hypothetical protein C8Q69DRAFT_452979 [Paecilomyces variotii]|uniref:C2H2-type domain-containing protein n=1 Tax=Byssochlamys spectabilis TaxID=264951 RepID=A0A443I7F5_BYSSP|nr:hypothetical protein C8Q69DRAFT_452979 [Paecilomyces variotii]RWQ99915.1 hypothetical protein C8Q69DRAFT_452979 [Paecilomyces variotii]